jgi:glyoxylase-like metal-dependent hydrolase (beta-lactamase superfamily II)
MAELTTLRTTTSPFRNLVHMLTNPVSGTALIIDPAWDLDKIRDVLAFHKVSLKYILLTHSHNDHINLVDELVGRYPDVEVYMSQAEIDFYGFRCKNLVAIRDFSPLHLDGFDVNPIFTPGHTYGSVCYLIDRFLFSGDTLFTEGCGICHGAGSDPEKMFDSLQTLKRTVHRETGIFPGHKLGLPIGKTLGSLLVTNLYLMLESKSHFVKFRMRKGQVGLFDFS